MTTYERMMSMFGKWLRGANKEDIELLLDEKARTSGVFHWDELAKECCLVNEEEVPWIPSWLASRYAKKHILQMRYLPNPDAVAVTAQRFIQKLHWKWYFRSEEGLKPTILVKTKQTPIAPPSFGKEFLPMELKPWTGHLAQKLRTGAVSAVGRFDANRSNTPCLALAALRILKSSPWVLVENDKDDGWTFMLLSELQLAHAQLLASDFYERVESIDRTSMAGVYRRWCYRIQKASGESGLAGRMLKSLNGCTFSSSLKVLIKSHNNPGEVKFRAVHASSSMFFDGMSMWPIDAIRPFSRVSLI